MVTQNHKIITGDLNAKIGTKTKEEEIESMRAFKTGEKNKRGDRLTEFADKHTIFIVNTLFQNRLVGLVVKASVSRAGDPVFESRLRRDCFGVESYQ